MIFQNDQNEISKTANTHYDLGCTSIILQIQNERNYGIKSYQKKVTITTLVAQPTLQKSDPRRK